MKKIVDNFLKSINYQQLDAKEYHKKFVSFIFGDFFEPFIYKKAMLKNKSYQLRNRTVYFTTKPVNPMRASREIFDHVPNMLDMQKKSMFDLKEHLNQVDTMDGKKDNPPKQFLINFGNSCAPDSILYLLFFFENGYFMDIISNNPGEPEFKEEFRNEIKEPLLDLYSSGKWNTRITEIQKIISKFTETSCYSIKSGTEIWNKFAEAFSNLQFEVQTKHGEKIKNTPYSATYLEPIEQNNPDNITSSPPHLIYADDYTPKKRDLRDEGFAMDHGEYYLSGALFFVSRGHYTAAIKGKDHWWYYDDVLSKRRILKNPESGIFEERPTKKSQILFYSKKNC